MRPDQKEYQKLNKHYIQFYEKMCSGIRMVEQILYNSKTGTVVVNGYFIDYHKNIKTKPDSIDENGNYLNKI